MICTCIQNKNYEEILSILQNVEMAEIRLDSCPLSDEQIEDLFANSDVPLIATCRAEGPDYAGAERKLLLAVEAGARFADLGIDAPVSVSRNFQKTCRRCGTEIIRSYHDFEGTPSDEVLQMALARCFRYGADIAKIVTSVKSQEDILRLESLYSIILENVDSLQGRLIAFGMGEQGKGSRIECLRRGAPFTYASLSDGDAVAPGQMAFGQMREAVYGSLKPFHVQISRVPSSKSFAQRAIMAAALAKGTSRLSGYTPCRDSEAAIKVARMLGATVRHEGDTLFVTGTGPTSVSLDRIHTGESGLLTRLMIPLCAVLGDGRTEIEGEGTLLGRPLTDAGAIMAAFGVLLSNLSPERRKELFVPLAVKGKLIPGIADISGAGGSQLISGLLMALPLCSRDSRLHVGDPKSIPYMYITLDVLRHFGINTRSEMEGDAQMLEAEDWSCCTGIHFSIRGGQKYHPSDFAIEGDWSAAANVLVAGAIFGSADVNGLDIHSLQADLAIVDILVEAGAVVSQLEDGQICSRRAPLEGFTTDLNHAPDLFPIVSVLAAFCSGESRITGLNRLQGKESDRAASICSMLGQLGVEYFVDGDILVVEGETLASRALNLRLLRGGEYSSNHDHRIALALKVAGLGADGPVLIDDEECMAKSVDTGFWPVG